jgi:uncharacterized Zn-binding protein involved in type VI secretion
MTVASFKRFCHQKEVDMSGKPVARLGDAGSHGGVITTASSTILVNGKRMARIGDTYGCPEHGPNPIVTGASHVFGQGQLVAHVGSKTACGATIIEGSPDTFVGNIVTFCDGVILDTPIKSNWLAFTLNEPGSCEGLSCEAYFSDGTVKNGLFNAQNKVFFFNLPDGH